MAREVKTGTFDMPEHGVRFVEGELHAMTEAPAACRAFLAALASLIAETTAEAANPQTKNWKRSKLEASVRRSQKDFDRLTAELTAAGV